MLVEIWSDIVCPWCAIGKARFEQALARFPNRDQVEVVWRSFELDPRAAQSLPEGLAAHLGHKYGSDLAGGQQMLDTMTARAAQEGLDFRFEIAQPGNTFDAHRLLHLAKEHGRQQELGARLFSAYLTEGRHIADHEVLKQIAVEAGLDEVEAKDVLASDRHADAVRADEAQARAYGIRGVPFFVVDQKYGVSGAQPAEALLEVLQTAWTESHPLTMVVTPHASLDARPRTAAVCDDGTCEVSPVNIHEIEIGALDDDATSLRDLAGSAVLIVNVASKCGLTPQYAGLERLHDVYAGRGFSVLGVPCNQFAGQEPGSSEEIREFCSMTYGITFPMTEKVEVNGDGRHALYEQLTVLADDMGHDGDVRWNFEKFLVAADGRVVGRFGPQVQPDDPALVAAIEAVLPA